MSVRRCASSGGLTGAVDGPGCASSAPSSPPLLPYSGRASLSVSPKELAVALFAGRRVQKPASARLRLVVRSVGSGTRHRLFLASLLLLADPSLSRAFAPPMTAFESPKRVVGDRPLDLGRRAWRRRRYVMGLKILLLKEGWYGPAPQRANASSLGHLGPRLRSARCCAYSRSRTQSRPGCRETSCSTAWGARPCVTNVVLSAGISAPQRTCSDVRWRRLSADRAVPRETNPTPLVSQCPHHHNLLRDGLPAVAHALDQSSVAAHQRSDTAAARDQNTRLQAARSRRMPPYGPSSKGAIGVKRAFSNGGLEDFRE